MCQVCCPGLYKDRKLQSKAYVENYNAKPLSISNPPKAKIPKEKACTVSTEHWHGKSPKHDSRVVKFLDMAHLTTLVF